MADKKTKPQAPDATTLDDNDLDRVSGGITAATGSSYYEGTVATGGYYEGTVATGGITPKPKPKPGAR